MRSAMFMVLLASSASAKQSFLWTKEQEKAAGFKDHVVSALPHTYVSDADLPTDFSWGNINGENYLTKNLNQHIPQYCGSCWAHAAVSALGDRIKIARKGKGIDVNLAVQHILNCGNAGSCHGGSSGGAYNWIHNNKDGVVFDTCNPYLACSSESDEGFCRKVNTKCSDMNVCRTCSTFTANGGKCAPIDHFPNATIAEHGDVTGEQAIMKEIYARGPVACGIDATQILSYHGGVAEGFCGGADHAISVVGWGTDAGKPYWIVRNSWGEYWGEMGYLRVMRGFGKDLCVENTCNWATPAKWTETNYPCNEDGSNCGGAYVDPSVSGVPLAKRM
eukprot:TRINITY_DN237_c0_g1_i1.p1 TRINITY_DN237_c0_g1~~TRINITY_DN237_c0_g1_i1.p1  ORF type:complete len:333 (+),score=118.12 TRINITY_DN237_c0_g1_i1:46-1044(+)